MAAKSYTDHPAVDAVVVTPSDTDDVSGATLDASGRSRPARSLYVGGTGNITLVTVDAYARNPSNPDTTLFTAVPVGVLTVQCVQVRSTGTGATAIVALF